MPLKVSELHLLGHIITLYACILALLELDNDPSDSDQSPEELSLDANASRPF